MVLYYLILDFLLFRRKYFEEVNVNLPKFYPIYSIALYSSILYVFDKNVAKKESSYYYFMIEL